jgi:hypothetical protein
VARRLGRVDPSPPETFVPPAPPPDALAKLLPPDVDLDAGWRHQAAVPVWYGVVWGRLGRGDLAFAHLDRVRLPELYPWIAAERGRILRELGLHAEAETIEFGALVQADDPVDDVMLRLSLAADAVGQGDGARARRRLAAADEALAALDDGPRAARQRLRRSWVAVEVAFLTGEPVPTSALTRLPVWSDAEAAPRWPADHQHGSAFHRAKGALFAGVVRDDPRLLDHAAAGAPPVLRWAIELARADRGLPAGEGRARAAWRAVVAPPGYTDAVAATPTGRRLGGRAAASARRRGDVHGTP